MGLPKLVFIGDLVSTTGFSTVTSHLLPHLHRDYDITVLATNYYGDIPHSYPYEVIPAPKMGEDYLMGYLGHREPPDLVVMVGDVWRVAKLAPILSQCPRSYAYVPVDGKNVREEFAASLSTLSGVATYTEFGARELAKAGLGDVKVIPHGIDLTEFYPEDRVALRRDLFHFPEDEYLVGVCNRNAPRKRLDLSVRYFAEFARGKDENVKLYYHGALDDVGWDIQQLSRYYGITDRMIYTSDKLKPGYGVPARILRAVYNIFDIQISTSMGEGWGLTTMEGMACAVPQIVGDWSGLGEWTQGAAYQIHCPTTYAGTSGVNMIMGVPDEREFVGALNAYYTSAGARQVASENCLKLVSRPEYRWENIAEKFRTFIQGA